MISYGLIILVFIVFTIQKCMNEGAAPVSEKSLKPYRYFKWFLVTAPVVAFVIFAVLFSVALKSRLSERYPHALIVLMLWLFATSFYTDLVFFWKNSVNRLFCIVGLIIAVSMAILLTPLDRFVALLGGFASTGIYIIGIAKFIVYYLSLFLPHYIKNPITDTK